MKQQPTQSWEEALEMSGDLLRPGAKDGQDARFRVLALTYKVNSAARRLELSKGAVEEAVIVGLIPSFLDPEGTPRIAADNIEAILKDTALYERIAALEMVHVAEIAAVSSLTVKTLSRKLQRMGADRERPEWGEVRGAWGLPESYIEFRKLLQDAQAEELAALEQQRHAAKLRKEEEERRRSELQARLVAAFPEWVRDDREMQKVTLHVGPPNSGKTYSSLQALVAAGSGWYLAPLRLLAYEIFDRLNRQGVPCNLLTGEEYIPIEGATITAATIEMFNSASSGECIVIDEAQMLADPDRGWAWTRAMIEAEAPEIHMIAPETAESLIRQMARAAELPIKVQKHQRLTPIRVSDVHVTLANLPPHTILVAFSRRRVLELKQDLESRGRSVSVVYGSLPPEVRRKQSDRFASGETEICIATDAVGMGLNLPADYVVFYEVEKFDGRESRKLRPEEVQQIGGRAGRYGFASEGVVAGTMRQTTRFLRKMFEEQPRPLTKARIAPTLQDLEMIPGTLAHKFREWSQLRSIPDSLRSLLQIANLEERISLAEMLTPQEVDQIGLEAAVKLVNAPTRQSTRNYWRRCARAIIQDAPMPLPPTPPPIIGHTVDLDEIEYCVSCADIYLWLAHREDFKQCAPELESVREQRHDWSNQIDEALLKRIRSVKSCSQCKKILPNNYPYGICEECYAGHHVRVVEDYS